ncbi:MAG: hypothetical protein ACREOA_02330 [Candidatus Dormibacteria bacterium]
MRAAVGMAVELVLGTALISACASTTLTVHPGPTPSPTHTALSILAAGRDYLAAVEPDDQAVAAFKAAPSNTLAELEAAAGPLISADERLETRLEAVNWPSMAVSDVHVLIVDLAQEVGSLQDLSTLTIAEEAAWEATFASQESAHRAAVDIVRSDLQLPAATPGYN